jgi:hypothetical protein
VGLSVKNIELERRVRVLASRRGLGITGALALAVDNELAKDNPSKVDRAEIKAAIREIQARYAALPIVDATANADDWMYGEDGMPR